MREPPDSICRRRTLYAQLRSHLGEVFKRLAMQKESRIEEGLPSVIAEHAFCGCERSQGELLGFSRLDELPHVIGLVRQSLETQLGNDEGK